MKSRDLKKLILKCVLSVMMLNSVPGWAQQQKLSDYSATERPWLWWYWLGSAVDKEGIDWHLQQFKELGYGGASIAATYGVEGYESKYIPFMSPRWIEMMNYTAEQSRKSGMRIDASLTSAWPFGGPNVTSDMAAQYSVVNRLFTAMPDENVVMDLSARQKGKLHVLSAYSTDGDYLDLTSKVGTDGILRFTFPAKKWDVYGLYSVPTGQMTKRSGLGGEGLVIDHFNKIAVEKYLERFDSLFLSSSALRATFNDSYEVYGADYSSVLLDEFKARRGYDLRKYLYLLDPANKSDAARRVLCDYRETISDLLLDNFVDVWHHWAERHGVKTVEQAHGSPANWLDLYGASDIPQTESFGASPLHIKNVRIDPLYNEKSFGRPDKMLLKFASSASHVMGKQLTSSETATWLGDHFKVALSQAKPQIDELFVSGINHIMLTCGAYSPKEIPFPGWHFDPAADFGHTTAFKEVMPDFSLFVARSQQLLQNSQPDNDVLLYMPMHDLWTECDDEDGRSKLMMFTIHNPDNWFYRQDVGDIARTLKREGFDFDYISDRQLALCKSSGKQVITPGQASYKAIVVPCCKRIPLGTLQQLEKLAASGVNIIFAYRMPRDIPGYYNVEVQRSELLSLSAKLKTYSNVIVDANYIESLKRIGIPKEEFGKHQLEYIRKRNEKGTFYFVANQSNEFQEGWIQLGKSADRVTLFNPLTGESGVPRTDGQRLFLQLKPGQSCFIKLYSDGELVSWDYNEVIASYRIGDTWSVSFKEGEPQLPASYHTEVVKSWTEAPDTLARYFSGTGIYETSFNLPSVRAGHYQLSLGDVREVAKVWVNDVYVGCSWSVPFELNIGTGILKKKNNKLRIEVRNLDANRMIWLDQNKTPWQTFFMVDVAYRNFSAAHWESVPSGLLGPIELKCCK